MLRHPVRVRSCFRLLVRAVTLLLAGAILSTAAPLIAVLCSPPIADDRSWWWATPRGSGDWRNSNAASPQEGLHILHWTVLHRAGAVISVDWLRTSLQRHAEDDLLSVRVIRTESFLQEPLTESRGEYADLATQDFVQTHFRHAPPSNAWSSGHAFRIRAGWPLTCLEGAVHLVPWFRPSSLAGGGLTPTRPAYAFASDTWAVSLDGAASWPLGGSANCRFVPIRVCWPGFIANSLVAGTAILLSIAARNQLRSWWRSRSGKCRACAHELVGSCAVCPECGHETLAGRSSMTG